VPRHSGATCERLGKISLVSSVTNRSHLLWISVHEVPRIAFRKSGVLEVGKQAFVDDLGNQGVRTLRAEPSFLIPKAETR
jgi:hypothetical protein